MNKLKRSPDVLATGCGMLFLLIAPYSACDTPAVRDPRVSAVYSKTSGKLEKLIYDANKNGRPDAWAYMDGTRIVRIEEDKDENGVVERWEYYDADRRLTRVGLSSAQDGKVDTWVYPGPDGKPARLERSTRRDGTVDHVEYLEQGRVVRLELDADHDGRIDRWQTYTDGRLAAVELDTKHTGAPDRRFVYRQDGTLLRVERPQLPVSSHSPSKTVLTHDTHTASR
jgi:hypothetical protein